MSPCFESNRAGALAWTLLAVLALAVLALGAVSGCNVSDNGDSRTKVNGSVHVAAGVAPESAATVNGSIHLDDNAAITSATTVNGSVLLGARAAATSIKTVNGGITLGNDAKLSGNAVSVNGEFTLNPGSEVSGSLTNVNGALTVSAAHVAGDITTVNGSITITGASHIDGGILVKKPSSELLSVTRDVPRIVIGPGATVQGELRFEHPVQLYVSDKATVGTVTGATAIAFSGDTPPT